MGQVDIGLATRGSFAGSVTVTADVDGVVDGWSAVQQVLIVVPALHTCACILGLYDPQLQSIMENNCCNCEPLAVSYNEGALCSTG